MTRGMLLAGLLALTAAPALAGQISPAERKTITQPLVNPRPAAEKKTEPVAESAKAPEKAAPVASTCQHA